MGYNITALAHTVNRLGVKHLLVDHLANVAIASGEFAAGFGLAAHGRLAGLLHDSGKFNPMFQTYLAQCEAAALEGSNGKVPRPGSVPHAALGATAALEPSVLAAMAVHGHHMGMKSRGEICLELKGMLQDEKTRRVLALIPEDMQTAGEQAALLYAEMQGFISKANKHDQELLIRLLFSALVDADWLDTERHFRPETSDKREVAWPLLAQMQMAFNAHMQIVREGLKSPLSTVNQVRSEVAELCHSAGSQPQGVFKLTVPTGGGKTLAALNFAIKHAIEHKLERIIMAIPYTSIIDQTAKVYREIFAALSPCPVIEHHSAMEPDGVTRQDEEQREQWQLATENWDAPLVVTTTVQLFDSLFSNRPARCRKLHNLARSVVVIDEVQTLPVGMLEPLVSVMNALVSHAHTSIVLSTATQPALAGQSRYLQGFNPALVREIIPKAKRDKHFAALRRVEYDVRPKDEKWSWRRVAEEMQQREQCLLVVNTKRDALEVLDELAANALGIGAAQLAEADRDVLAHALTGLGVLHLSTNLCGAHRQAVLDEVRQRLDPKHRVPIRLVSTQVVEAGVDIDFPVVLRAMGPLDRIVQAAGRCNREGKLGDGGGRMVVFRPENGGMPPGEYRTGCAEAVILLDGYNADLHDPAIFTQYFTRLTQDVNTDKRGINPLRAACEFPKVAERALLIDSDTEGVLITYGLKSDKKLIKLITQARESAAADIPLSRKLLRKLQPYMVNVFRSVLCKYEHLVDRDDIPGLTLWTGRYDPLRGLVCEAQPDDFVV